jgi:HSP20 family molecular chaperone IbpA
MAEDPREGLTLHASAADPYLRDLEEVRERIDALVARDVGPDDPRADLIDLGDAYQLVVDVPGVDQSHLEVGWRGDELVVAGERDAAPVGGRAIFRERPHGAFERRIRPPDEVDPERLSAHLRAGTLVVTLPKRR